MKSDPALYQLAKAAAIQKGMFGPGRENNGQISRPAPKQTEITPAQLAAMAEYDHDTCVAYFHTNANAEGHLNAGKLAKENPAAYQRLKLAAQGHNLLPDEPTVAVADYLTAPN